MEPKGLLPHSQLPDTCPCLSLVDPAHARTSHFLKIHLNVILPSMCGSPKWFLPLRFPHQNPVYSSTLPHTSYMARPSHSYRFDHPNNIGWGVQIIKLLFMYFSPLSWSLIFLKILLWITWQFCVFVGWQCGKRTTGCPTRYRTRYFFNNFTTNEDIATKFEADLPHCVRNITTT